MVVVVQRCMSFSWISEKLRLMWRNGVYINLSQDTKNSFMSECKMYDSSDE